MCGINGVFSINKKCSQSILENQINKMNDEIIHRGPDDSGCYVNDYCSLGMRRLSIIDLATGHQPIYNEDKSMVIVFNGEIYNFKKLKEELIIKGHFFKTESDTEVILHLYEEYRENAFKLLNGMFSIAIYEIESNRLIIARDKVGEKPLYYALEDDKFYFASELKSLNKVMNSERKIDLKALNTYFTLTYIPAPMTIYKGIRKLEPGCFIIVDKNGEKSVESYYDVNKDIGNYINDYEICKSQLRNKLTDAVDSMMMSDVPLGAFLSGGIDSSIIVGLMSKLSNKPIKTFSIGFADKEFDESNKALRVSKYNNTEHYSKVLDYKDAINWLDKVLENVDEPFADSSLLPSYYVSQFAKEHVSVALTGDGGDEMFGGYSKYLVNYYSKLYNNVPKIISEGLFEPILMRVPDKSSIIRKVKKVVRNKNVDLFTQRKNLMFLGFHPNEPLFKNGISDENATSFIDTYYDGSIQDEINRTLYMDMKIVLEGDMLAKVDRMTMLASLESRAPFLHSDILELAFRIPSKFKIRGKDTKYILKDTFSDLLPSNILNKTKQGFGVPVGNWFRGPLKKELEQLLSFERIEEQGIFNYNYISQIFNEHMIGKENHSFRLWTLFVFQRWYFGENAMISKSLI